MIFFINIKHIFKEDLVSNQFLSALSKYLTCILNAYLNFCFFLKVKIVRKGGNISLNCRMLKKNLSMIRSKKAKLSSILEQVQIYTIFYMTSRNIFNF